MRARRSVVTAMALAVPFLSACQTGGGGPYGAGNLTSDKTLLGAGMGAAAGGLIGAAAHGGAAGIVGGVLLGGLVGGAAGDYLTQQDQRNQMMARQQALEEQQAYRPVSWNNPQTGAAGSVTPVRTYQTASGQYCREFQENVTINGQRQNAYGTACLQPDGSWRVVS